MIVVNKRFLWAGVGAPGSVHDPTLLQSSPIFHEIESGHVLPNNVLTLPQGKFRANSSRDGGGQCLSFTPLAPESLPRYKTKIEKNGTSIEN